MERKETGKGISKKRLSGNEETDINKRISEKRSRKESKKCEEEILKKFDGEQEKKKDKINSLTKDVKYNDTRRK